MVQTHPTYIEKGVKSKKYLFLAKQGTAGGDNIPHLRSSHNKYMATSIIFCKANDCSLKVLNDAGRH